MDKTSEDIERDTKEFLAKGGKIETVLHNKEYVMCEMKKDSLSKGGAANARRAKMKKLNFELNTLNREAKK